MWAYDLASGAWSEIAVGGPKPDPRFGHTAAWVPGFGVVVWSGQGQSGFFNDMWSFDPESGAWRQLPSEGAVPAARYGSCASLGPDGQLWISHGFTDDGGRFADTWAYDFTTASWHDMTPAGVAPVKRCLHDCFWSSDGTHLVLYGGQTTGIPALGDIWAFDPTRGEWSEGAPSQAPARQLYALAAMDGGALVFGGGALDRTYLDDTWLIDADSLDMRPLTLAGAPPARSGATLVADSARGRVVLFGGLGSDGPLSDLWQLDGLQ